MHHHIKQLALLLPGLLLTFTSSVSAALKLQEIKYGVIGLGIPMYKPVCCYACHDALSALYLNCTTFSDDHHSGMDMKLRKRMDMGGESMADTSNECRTTDQTWLQTLAYCITSRCTEEGAGEGHQAQCFQMVAAGMLPVQSLQASIPSQAPTAELADDDEWLNTTHLVNPVKYADNWRTLDEFAKSEERHTRYSLVIWLVTIGLILIAGAYTFYLASVKPGPTSSLVRMLNQHLFMPSLFGSRQLEPLPYNIGYVPSRVLSLFIFIYVSLNFIFCCVSYSVKSPNTWFSTDRDQLVAYISNRTGVLSYANLGLAIVFSGRNNILVALTGWSQTTFLTIHRWVSRVATVQAIVHSIIYTLTYFWSGGAAAYYAEAAKAYYWWGIIATVALSIAITVSVLPIRLRAYEFFLITHILLAILAIAGCWYHVELRFKRRWGYEVWIYLAMAFWGFDRLIRFARVAWYNEWRGLTPSIVEKIPGSDFLQITVFPGKRWINAMGPGKHTFLAFPGKFWESHPFTIADWGSLNPNTYKGLAFSSDASSGEALGNVSSSEKTPKEIINTTRGEAATHNQQSCGEGEFFIRFLLRPHTGSTRTLFQKLTTSSSPSHKYPLRILTEGPYAGHSQTLYPLKHADTILCITGGVGVTYSLGVLKQYLALQNATVKEGGSRKKGLTANATRFVFAWSAREEGLIRHVTQQMIPYDQAESANVEIKIWQTGGADKRLAGEKKHEHSIATGGEKDEGITATTTSPSSLSSSSSHSTSPSPSPSAARRTQSNTITSLTTGTRMHIPSVIESVLEPSRRVAVLVCAPGGMTDEVRKSVVRAVGNGFEVQLIEEAFAW